MSSIGFDPDRQTHHVFADSGGGELRGAHLLVRRARRVYDQRLGIADIGQMTREPQRFDELRPGRPAALDAEADHRTRSVRQQTSRQLMVRVDRAGSGAVPRPPRRSP